MLERAFVKLVKSLDKGDTRVASANVASCDTSEFEEKLTILTFKSLLFSKALFNKVSEALYTKSLLIALLDTSFFILSELSITKTNSPLGCRVDSPFVTFNSRVTSLLFKFFSTNCFSNLEFSPISIVQTGSSTTSIVTVLYEAREMFAIKIKIKNIPIKTFFFIVFHSLLYFLLHILYILTIYPKIYNTYQ